MFDTPDVMKTAQSLARHSGTRHALIARNIANADTPGYRARDLTPFAETMRDDGPRVAARATRPGHILHAAQTTPWRSLEAAGEASPDGNTVTLEAEMVRATQARSDHATALAVYRSSLEVLRTAIGRGG